jgi:hypothetical protein
MSSDEIGRRIVGREDPGRAGVERRTPRRSELDCNRLAHDRVCERQARSGGDHVGTAQTVGRLLGAFALQPCQQRDVPKGCARCYHRECLREAFAVFAQAREPKKHAPGQRSSSE